MLIIGKTNLSEWTGKKGYLLPGGWSAVGGQTQTPYVVGGYVKGDKSLGHSNPCGSSSGSAVGVAAGFALLALGTETDGSVTQPAGRASLYAIKATVGGISTEATSPYSAFSDSVGPIVKTPEDLAILLGILMKRDFTSDLAKSWRGQKIAFLDRTDWIFIRTAARDNGFDNNFAKFDVDLVVSLLGCRVGSMSAAEGYPHATVPLGYADNFNGRAYGLTIVAGAGQENKIIQFMSAWEASHPNLRNPPPRLVNWGCRNASM